MRIQLDAPRCDVSLTSPADLEAQINVPPGGHCRLWKVVALAVRCPACVSTNHKAETGKRLGAEGLMEHYRRCRDCGIRFRVVFE